MSILIGAVALAIIGCIVILVVWQPGGEAATEGATGGALPQGLVKELAEAQALEAAGDLSGACKAARAAAKKHEHPLAWGALGQCACREHNLKLASEALSHLGPDVAGAQRPRDEALRICKSLGYLQDGEGRLVDKNGDAE
jgi:hypothetical protein